jgi:uncharacterized protein (TIGR03437 family)
MTILDYQATPDNTIVTRTGVGSISRAFTLPIELSGVTVAINGAACGLKSVSTHHIVFVAPPGLPAAEAGTIYSLVVNNNGVIMRTFVTLVPARPDVFRKDGVVAPGGRAKVFNVTNTVQLTEPFPVRTIQRKGNKLVPSMMRVYLTGVTAQSGAVVSIEMDGQTMLASNITLVEPGVYTADFTMATALDGGGDSPVVVNGVFGSTTFSSRVEDTAPRIFIL